MTYCQWPFKGKFRFGTLFGVPGKYWSCGWHTGLDFSGGGSDVYPIKPGNVQQITTTGSYGNCVYIWHPDDNTLTLYAHLKTIKVKKGQACGYNTVLGVEGATGNVTGRHLHLELHQGSYKYPPKPKIDPKSYIEKRLKPVDPTPPKEEDMTEAQTKAMIDKALEGYDPTYKNVKDIPAATGLRPEVQEMKAAGYIKGTERGDLDKTQKQIEGMVIAWRAVKGEIGKLLRDTEVK